MTVASKDTVLITGRGGVYWVEPGTAPTRDIREAGARLRQFFSSWCHA